MNITYFGHSAFQVDTSGKTLLFDPFITSNPLAEEVISVDALHPDVIILTHAHFDHWGDTMEIARQSEALIVSNHEISQYIQRQGYENVLSMNIGGSVEFEWGKLMMTYARHSSSFSDGTYGGTANGYLLYSEGKCVYNSGDTDVFFEMQWIGENNEIDLALLPIGDLFTMGLVGSINAVKLLEPKLTIPIHYNTFPPIAVEIKRWLEMMEAGQYSGKVLKPGESLELN